MSMVEMKFANRHGYSDVDPFEIVKVVSDKTIEVRAMDAERDPSWKPEFLAGGFAGHCTNQFSQKWFITPNESNPVYRLRLRKDGYFHHPQLGKFRLSYKAVKFYDYNF